MPTTAILDESKEMLISTLTILGTELVHAEKETTVTRNTFGSFIFLIKKIIFFEYRFVCVYVYLFKNVNNKLFNRLSLSRILGVCRQ